MDTYTLKSETSVWDVVKAVQDVDKPLIIQHKEDECMIVMRPAVFERLLFQGELLEEHDRRNLRF